MTLAAVRPESWNLPLLLHVLGAMVVVGALVVVAWTLVKAWRGDVDGFTRIAYKTLLYVAIPSALVMRLAGQWIASEENLEDSDAAWIGLGYAISESSLLFLIIATVLTGLAGRRLRRDGSASPTLGRVAVVLTLIPLVAYLVAIWAMTAKPT